MWSKAEVKVVTTVVFDDEGEATLFHAACRDALSGMALTTSQMNVVERFIAVSDEAQAEANEIRNYLPKRGER